MGRIRQAFRRRGGEVSQDDVNVTTVIHSVLTSYAPEDPENPMTVVDDTVVSSIDYRGSGGLRGDSAVTPMPPLSHRTPPSALTGSLSDRAALLHELVDAHTRRAAATKPDEQTPGAGGHSDAAAPSPSGMQAAAESRESSSPASLNSPFPALAPRPASPWASVAEVRHAGGESHTERGARRTLAPVAHGGSSPATDGRPGMAPAVTVPGATTPPPQWPSPRSAPASAEADYDDADELVDTRQIGNYLGFVFRSIRRHWFLFAVTALLMASATTAATMVWPKSYQVYATLLVQRNEKMASLVNPGRTISPEAESPTRAAEQIVLQQQNLRALIQQTDLLWRWEQTRTPLFRLKDRVFAYLRGPQSQDDKVDSMVGLLEARLKVFTTPEGSVTFELRWPEPQTAYDIVDHAVQNFLEFRKQTETSAIADSIAILDQSVETLEEKVRQTISELPKRRPAAVARRPVEPAPAAPAAAVAAVVPVQPPPADLVNRLTRMKTEIEARRREVTRLDDLHRQQLSEAQTRLAAAKTVYGDDFPTVMALRQTVEQLTRESPELTSLRRDTQAAEAEYDSLAATLQTPSSNGAVASALPPELQLRPSVRTSSEPPPLEVTVADSPDAEMSDPTTLRLRVELAELASVRGRANAARAELSSSQAGFKYQYTIITPPQMPRGPVSPNVPAFIGGGIVASLLLALLAVVMADLLSDRFLESWQVEHHLGVPVGLSVQELS